MKSKIMISVMCLMLTAALITALTSCKSEETKNETSSEAETTTEKVYGTEYTYFTDALTVTKSETEYVFTVPPVPTRPEKDEEKDKEEDKETEKQTSQNLTRENQENASSEKIDEISSGISLLSKVTEVSKGSTATFIVKCTPNASLTLDLYDSNSDPSSHKQIMKTSADSNGIATLTFNIDDSVDSGNRKVIIEEVASDSFLQTSVTVR